MKSKFGTRPPRYAAALLAMLCCAASAGCDRKESAPAPEAPTLVLDRAPAGMKTRDAEFGGKVRLLGYTMNQKGTLKAGKRGSVTLYWQAKEKIEPGYRLVSQLLDDAGERVLDLDNAGPLREHKDGKPLLPPEAWEPGKVYVDQLAFTVPAAVKTWRVVLVAGLKKGEEAMKLNDPESTDGMAFVASSATGVRQRPSGPPALRVDRLDPKQKLKIDGKLDEDAWKEATVTALGEFNTGKVNSRARLNANVRVLYEKTGFYVGFEVKDSDVVAGTDPRLAPKDAVELMIDPDGDGDNLDYYQIRLSPLNVAFDTQYDSFNVPVEAPNGPYGHEEWAAKMKSAVTVQGTLDKSDDKDEGYVVEAFLPWASFTKAKKTPPDVGDTWRLNFYVVEETGALAWSSVKKISEFPRASRFGHVLWAEKGFVPKADAPEGAEAAAAGSALPPPGEALPATKAPMPEGSLPSPAVKPPAATPAIKPPAATPAIKAPAAPSPALKPPTPTPTPATSGK